MKDGTIVTLVFTNGMEVVGKYIIDDMVNYTIYKPRLVQVTQQGVGLVNGICMTGKEPKSNVQFAKNGVLFMVETSDEIANGWTQQTSGLTLPQKGLTQGLVS
jgi:hypothetical protein